MTQKIDIDKIRIDGGTQPRTKINPDLVTEYANRMSEGEIFPPITVYYDGIDYWLGDGFHRLLANQNLDFQEMDCDIRKGTIRDAILFSCGTNDTHGLRRSSEDKRKSVETLLKDEEWMKWSNIKIAEQCKVDEKTVRNIRAELENLSSENPKIETKREYRRNGKIHSMNVAKIGKARKNDKNFSAPENAIQNPEGEDCIEEKINLKTAIEQTVNDDADVSIGLELQNAKDELYAWFERHKYTDGIKELLQDLSDELE